MTVGLILFLIMGLIAGFIARALVPGPDPMGWVGTMVLGVIGSFIGGTLAALLFGGSLDLNAAGIIGSIIGAISSPISSMRSGTRKRWAPAWPALLGSFASRFISAGFALSQLGVRNARSSQSTSTGGR